MNEQSKKIQHTRFICLTSSPFPLATPVTSYEQQQQQLLYTLTSWMKLGYNISTPQGYTQPTRLNNSQECIQTMIIFLYRLGVILQLQHNATTNIEGNYRSLLSGPLNATTVFSHQEPRESFWSNKNIQFCDFSKSCLCSLDKLLLYYNRGIVWTTDPSVQMRVTFHQPQQL